MTIEADREFSYFERGEKREELLTSFRVAMRALTNPETALAFTEEEIAIATGPGSQFWIEADAIDGVLLAEQSRAIWLADQVRKDRASDAWLDDYHGPALGEERLPAFPSQGSVDATAQAGIVWTGSSTIADPSAVYGTLPNGVRVQVLTTVVTDGSGDASLPMVAVDPGKVSNADAGTIVTWVNAPLGAEAEGTVDDYGLTGGADRENASEYSERLAGLERDPQGAGNSAQMRGWARESSTAIEDAFVYSCFAHAGSTQVCITKKRGSGTGPDARIPDATLLTTARAALVPPGSPDVPENVYVIVTPPTAVDSDIVLGLTLPFGQPTGWKDARPFPNYSTTKATVTVVTTQTNFRIYADDANLPAGVTAPSLMVWDEAASRFVSMLVSSVTKLGANDYQVQLTTAPSVTIATGMVVSPDTARRLLVAETIEAYFDSLGAGEVVNLDTDTRGHRCARYPDPTLERPQRAGSVLTAWLQDAFGLALTDSLLHSISETSPGIPVDANDGPEMLTLGSVGVYPN